MKTEGNRTMHHRLVLIILLAFTPASGYTEEAFVTIQKVIGNRITIVKGASARGGGGDGAPAQRGRGRGMRGGDDAGANAGNAGGGVAPAGRGRGRGMRAGAAIGGEAIPVGRGRGRGMRGAGSSLQSAGTTVVVPSTAKITTAMRERRTFEFRVLGELAGGLRHRVFQNMQQPLQARIVTKGNTIIEINVITGDTDINQTATSASGATVIAVRPKRPPMKKP